MRNVRILAAALLAAVALLALPTAAPAVPRYSMLAEINSVRAYMGLHPLRMSASLNRSSYRFGRYLMRRDRFGHASRIRASRTFRALGEVLEKHSGTRPRVRATLWAWLRSPGHRAILLSRRFHWVGLSRVSGRFRGRRATIWVGHFGRR